jgi:MFS family permease
MAWGILGVVVFSMSGIPSLIFLRRRPEDMGLLPDGASSVSEKSPGGPSREKGWIKFPGFESEPIWTRSQAIRAKAFWMLTFLNCLIPFLQAGINFHIYPFLTDQGSSEMSAVLILSTISVFGMIGSPIWGILVEKFRIQGLLTINVLASGLVFLLLYWAVKFKVDGALGTGIVFFLAALHGAFHGGRHPMINLAWAEFFGRRSLGSILSLSNPFYYTANAIGPVFAALCFDLSGSYAFPFHFFVFIFFFSGIIAIRLQSPKHPSQAPMN